MNKRAPNDPSEAMILKSILDWLTVNGIFHFRCNTGAGMMSNAKGAARFVRFGAKGCPDIVGIFSTGSILDKWHCHVDGIFFGIEVKTRKGVQSPDQKAFQLAVEKAGGLYILARSLKDLKDRLG